MEVYQNIKKQGIILPPPPAKGGSYIPAKRFGNNLIYLSGCGPQINGNVEFVGKVGKDVTEEQGGQSAERCILNALAVLEKEIGDLNQVKSIVKILAFVASDDEFYKQPQVADYASKLLQNIFGEEVGIAARSAIGVNVLPGNIPVEIELLVEVTQ